MAWDGGNGAYPVSRESGVSEGGTDGAAGAISAEGWLCMPRASTVEGIATSVSSRMARRSVLRCRGMGSSDWFVVVFSGRLPATDP
jgi:hypothetical protein